MPDLKDGESVPIQGSARLPYMLKNVGGVYSCSCPAWRNQSLPIERRTCKHLRSYRSDAAEQERIGQFAVAETTPAKSQPKAAPNLLLAVNWDNTTDLTGWWVSEKLDGVRAWWDGKRFLSRQGNVYHAPDWFTVGLPNLVLDGEIHAGRKRFQETVSIVRRHDKSDGWKRLAFMMFDAPGVKAPFEERQKFLCETFTSHFPSYGVLLAHDRCRGPAHLQSELDRIVSYGGEGLMLRQPGSLYEAGRSPTLVKLKRFHDAEAYVIDHLPGKGRHRGRLGALLVHLGNGITFSVGTGFSDAERENPPAIGSKITFRYQELTDRGVPRFPTFVRVRTDNALPTLG